MLQHFDYYANSLNWQVIPIYINSKIPIFKQWNKNYNKNLCRDYIEKNPKTNIGLLLGDIIDVEADSEEANLVLNELTKNIKHPKYCSEKSIHHLFKCPDSKLTRIVINDIEFRGRSHQSLLPPSTNVNGVVYKWIDLCEIPNVPEPLLNFYNKHFKKISPVHIWERPVCWHCKKKIKIMRKRFILEKKAFYDHGLKWQCNKCREIDVREYCRIIRRQLY